MFAKIKKIIQNVTERRRTEIDQDMLKLIQKFMQEEELILNYSVENRIDKRLAKYELCLDEKLELKNELSQVTEKYGEAYNSSCAYSMSIEQLRHQLEKLNETNRALRF